MNNIANNHNEYILQGLAMSIARSIIDLNNGSYAQQDDDHKLEK